MHPKHLSIHNFNYTLPAEKIALYPLPRRDLSKLLIWHDGKIEEDIYRNIADHLPEQSILIFNNTKVIPARIRFTKDTGGTIEIFCLEPFVSKDSFGEEEYTSVMAKKEYSKWKCMIGGAGKWKSGKLEKKIIIKNDEVIVRASLIEKLPDAYVAEFRWHPSHYTFAEIIEKAGVIPLPPYIKRKAEEVDKERYQTIYAEHEGSVAAPTAGLHFTPTVFSSLGLKNIITDFVTLHVGAGTFKPVTSGVLEEHEMHAEWIDVPASTIENILHNLNKNIVTVGTTSLRTIESLYWMGVKLYLNKDCRLQDLEIKQWEVYEEPLSTTYINAATAVTALLNGMRSNGVQRLFARTRILIAPGYTFRIANALVTNFHQPKSTLLLLIAAITPDWKKIYSYALENEYRFLSYGDGCLFSFLPHQAFISVS